MQGRIKLHRKAQSNPISTNLELFGLFSFFLIKANHSTWSFFLWQQKIDLLPWQFVWSMQWIADHFSISKPKAYRLTELLEKSEIVKRKWYSKYTLFTIVNRWSYQWEWNAIVTTSETPPYTNNNDKKKEEWKKSIRHKKFFDNIDDYYNEIIEWWYIDKHMPWVDHDWIKQRIEDMLLIIKTKKYKMPEVPKTHFKDWNKNKTTWELIYTKKKIKKSDEDIRK